MSGYYYSIQQQTFQACSFLLIIILIKALYLMTSAFGNLITLLIVALFSTIGFEQVINTVVYNRIYNPNRKW